jgi:fructose-1,6-bisphosphatase II
MRDEGYSRDQILTVDDLCRSDDVSLALTGISDGDLVKGVQYGPRRIRTHSLAMRSRSHSLRWITTVHDVPWLRQSGRRFAVEDPRVVAER